MKKIELLAPAGSMESLKAAVQSGADAVYLGGSKFSARAYATNFNEENMKDAIDYCHLYGVKVYVTINTILKEEEILEALEYANYLYNINVDAVIIQDLGLAYLIKKYVKDLEIHASTQMTVHNAEGALFLKEKGFSRIVLSRELSIDEITYISKEVGVETEVFIHGALCISYSGQCLMSSIIGGRSGNRGRCAQPCRLPYKLINKTNGMEKEGYIMSPKDICTIENIGNLIESETCSLKIEGRMKRPEYVAGVVKAYRKSIDNYYNKLSYDKKDEDKKVLSQLFNREGFSKAYLYGNWGKDMMAFNFPKNMGLYLGKVLKDKTIMLEEDISIKDGIRVEESGFIVSNIIKDGNEVVKAKAGDRVKLKPAKYKTGDILYKTSDNELLEGLSNYYKEIHRKYELNLEVIFKVGSPILLKCEFMGNNFEVTGEVVEEALNKPLNKERVISSLNKTGDTPFTIKEINFVEFNDGFLRISSINDCRRELLEKIQEGIFKKSLNSNKINLDKIKEEHKNKGEKDKTKLPNVMVSINTMDQYKACRELGFENIAISIFNKLNNLDINKLQGNIYLKVPNIIKDREWNYLVSNIEKYIPKIEGIITGNLGIINKFKGITKILGDYKINMFNSFSYEFLEDLDLIYMSTELNRKEIRSIAKNIGKDNKFAMVLYGRYELMVSEYCPIGAFYGGKTIKTACNESCREGEFYLKDRIGEEFLIKTDKFCRSYVYNNARTNLIDVKNELYDMGIKSYRIDFIDEDYEESKKVLSYFLGKEEELPSFNYTKGHYKRGVE